MTIAGPFDIDATPYEIFNVTIYYIDLDNPIHNTIGGVVSSVTIADFQGMRFFNFVISNCGVMFLNNFGVCRFAV